jgi:hypothetical protein
MCFLLVKGHMSILYVDCKKFLTNQFVKKFCPYDNDWLATSCQHGEIMIK